jgi:hypothetical protein
MRFFKILFYTITVLLMLQGCNDDKDNVSNPPEDVPTENETNNADTDVQNETSFDFTSFDLDVDYEDNNSYNVDYENENDGMEAKLNDTINNETLQGDEAFERLRPIFEDFTFNKDTSNDEVINEVLQAFGLSDDYTKFELEIQFTDGTEKEYEQVK